MWSATSAPPPSVTPADDPWRTEERLNSLVPTDPSESYDINELIELIFDDGTFFPVHAAFAPNVSVGFARLHGQTVAVIIDEVNEERIVGRSYADAPEIDGLVYLAMDSEVEVGEIVNVTIEDTDEYDMFASLA